MEFQPDYLHVINTARNVEPRRIPLYEHLISEEVMEKILGIRFAQLADGDLADR